MAYATAADVQLAVGGSDNLVALADTDANGTSDAGLLDAAIAEGDALINSYAAMRYAVPFAMPSTAITALSARIAGRILRRNRGMVMEADVEAEKMDRAWLEDLAAGKVTPGVAPTPTKSELVTDKVGERDSTKAVSRAALKGFW